ncbi:MAG: contractile injection system tape measure protein [Bacteroidota bacterium]
MNHPKWPHRIEQHRFELESESESQAKFLQDQISSNYASRIEQVLEQVLDEFDQTEVLIRLDRLEVNLGSIREEEFIPKLCELLQKELRNALADAIRRIPFEEKKSWEELPKRGKISLHISQMEQLGHFLRFGYFPSWTSTQQRSPLELWEEMKQQQPQLLEQMIAELSRERGVGERIQQLLPAPEIRWVLSRLIPGFAESHQAFQQQLIETAQSLPYLNFPRREMENWLQEKRSRWFGEENLRDLDWKARSRREAIEYLLQHPAVLGRGLSPDMTLHQMANHLSAKEKEQFLQELKQTLADSLRSIVPEPETDSPMTQPREPEKEEARIGASEIPGDPWEWLSPQGWIDWLLTRWLEDDSPWWAEQLNESISVQAILEKVFQHHASALSQALLTLSPLQIATERKKKLAKNLAHELSEAQRFHLLEKMEPQRAGFFFSLFKAIEQYSNETFGTKQELELSFWQNFWTEWFTQGSSWELGKLTRLLLLRMAEEKALLDPALLQAFPSWIQHKVQAGEKRWFPIQTMLTPPAFQSEREDSEAPVEEPGEKEISKQGEERFEESREEEFFKSVDPIEEEGKQEAAYVPEEADIPPIQKEGQDEESKATTRDQPEWMTDLPLEIQRSLMAEGRPDPSRQEELGWMLTQVSYLLRHGSLPLAERAEAQRSGRNVEQWLRTLLKEAGKSYRFLVERMLMSQEIRRRVARQFNREEFALLVQGLGNVRGDDWPSLIQAFLAVESLLPDQTTALNWRGTLLNFLIERKDQSPVPYQLFHRLIRTVHRQGTRTATEFLQQIETQLSNLELSDPTELKGYVQLMQQELAKQPLLRPPSPETEAAKQAKEIRHGSVPIRMNNAGLVLVWPFFPHYFNMLGLLTPKRQFKDEAAQAKAPHFLQYLVNKQTDAPESELTLNKLLCGVPFETPIPASLEMTEAEQELGEGLIRAAIQQWGALKKVSPDGMRGSFFIREGSMSPKGKHWEIQVEAKPYDLLIDRLPWGLSVIKFPWMTQALHVQWR